jgi:hypothetical protein
MRTFLPAWILASMIACTAPVYVQPRASDPHAIVKLRSTFHHMYRSSLSQEIFLDEWAIDPRLYGDTQGRNADTVHIRIRPEPSWFTVRTVFSYLAARRVAKLHTVIEPVTCGSPSTGMPETCTRARTELRNETEYYTVIDASCEDRTFLRPNAGAVYLLQYDFYGNTDCRLTCFEQLPVPDGRFQLVPCPR